MRSFILVVLVFSTFFVQAQQRKSEMVVQSDGSAKEIIYQEHSLHGLQDFAAGTLWTPRNENKKYWNLDGDHVEFTDCIGGQVGFVAGYTLFNCYLPNRTIGVDGQPQVSGFKLFYVHIASVGFTFSWTKHVVRLSCDISDAEERINSGDFFAVMASKKAGIAPLFGGKFSEFDSYGGRCIMYGISVGFEADLSVGAVVIKQSSDSYL